MVAETEIAAPVVSWLTAGGWAVYQEVRVDAVADIVATSGPLLWIIEAKRSMGFAVMNQAIHWLPFAHYVSVATEISGSTPAATILLQSTGIGWMKVRTKTSYLKEGMRVEVSHQPSMHRRVRDSVVRRQLHERQKDYCPAGTPGGGAWSPYKGTCENLLSYVKGNPGCGLSAAIKAIKHHYRTQSSAVSSLHRWIDAGKVPGVKLVTVGRKLHLYEASMVVSHEGIEC